MRTKTSGKTYKSARKPTDTTSRIFSPLLEFVLKNPFVTLWNIALLVGGFIAYVFFLRIGYLPEIDLKSAASFLLGIAFSGLLITVVIALTFIAPAWVIYSNVWKSYCLFEKKAPGSKDEPKQVSKDLEGVRTKPFLISSFVQGIMAFAAWILIIGFITSEKHSEFARALQLIGAGIFIPLLFLQCYRYHRISEQFRREEKKIVEVLGRDYYLLNVALFWYWFIMWTGLMWFVLLAASDLKDDDFIGFGYILVFFLLVVAANSSASTLNFDSPRKGQIYFVCLATGFVLLMAYLNLPNNKISIPGSAFNTFALGNVSNASFAVNRQACETVNLLYSGGCVPSSSGNLGCIRPKSVASRVGAEFLLVMAAKDNTSAATAGKNREAEVKFPLKKSDVLMWTFGSEKEVPEACKSVGHGKASIETK